MCIHTFLDLVYTNTLPSICPSFTLTRVALDKPFSFSSVSFILIVLLRPAAVGEAGEVIRHRQVTVELSYDCTVQEVEEEEEEEEEEKSVSWIDWHDGERSGQVDEKVPRTPLQL